MRLSRRHAIAPLALAFGALALFWIAQMATFVSARNQISQEWDARMADGPRTPAEIRALLESIREDGQHPKFVPDSLVDNSVCAGNIVSAVNFILGEERLTSTSAWTFEQENEDLVERIFARQSDFEIINGAITEIHDQGFNLDGILDMVGEGDERNVGRVYVVGYHYRDTLSDPTILAAHERGGTLNSHLMLLLGKANGRWYGYHLFHDPNRPNANPFEVIDMGECEGCEDECEDFVRCMPQMFDLMYIWKVLDVDLLPLEGAPIRLVQNSAPYAEVIEAVGTRSRYLDHFLDTIRAHRANLGDNFPRIIRSDEAVVDLSSGRRRQEAGQLLGMYNGVNIYRHIGDSRRGDYGLEYQCVELVNRYYATELDHANMTRTGDADTYWYAASSKDLVRFPNGSDTPPAPDDILTFDPEGDDDVPGHVAIVTSVSDTKVCVVQQNAQDWRQCFSLEVRGGTYTIVDTFSNMPAVGWSRRAL